MHWHKYQWEEEWNFHSLHDCHGASNIHLKFLFARQFHPTSAQRYIHCWHSSINEDNDNTNHHHPRQITLTENSTVPDRLSLLAKRGHKHSRRGGRSESPLLSASKCVLSESFNNNKLVERTDHTTDPDRYFVPLACTHTDVLPHHRTPCTYVAETKYSTSVFTTSLAHFWPYWANFFFF